MVSVFARSSKDAGTITLRLEGSDLRASQIMQVGQKSADFPQTGHIQGFIQGGGKPGIPPPSRSPPSPKDCPPDRAA